MEHNQHPEYVPPEVTTYTDEEILEALGPAQAGNYDASCSIGGC